MLRDVVAEVEREYLARLLPLYDGDRADQTKRLLQQHVPVLRFEGKENFFPMSALLYLVCSTIWYIPLKKPWKDYSEIGRLDILRTSPHVQLDVDSELESLSEDEDRAMEEGPEQRVDLVGPGLGRLFAAPEASSYDDVRRVVWRKIHRLLAINRFRIPSEKEEEAGAGILALHFADTIQGWWLWCPRLWLPRNTPEKAREKYTLLTGAGEDVCYYGRVVDQCGYRILQYWFFYAFNDWWSDLPFVNKHEGDWECVFIFGKPTGDGGFIPTHTAYSSHGNRGKKVHRRWEDVEKFDGSHPVVYVARGSHANYYTAGRHHWFLADSARGDGRVIEPGEWGEIQLLIDDEPWDEPEWLFFRGFWGAHIRDFFTTQSAPAGPHYSPELITGRPRPRSKWWKPREWAGLNCMLEESGVECDHDIRGWAESRALEWEPYWGGMVRQT
jgi:hypothetical protein